MSLQDRSTFPLVNTHDRTFGPHTLRSRSHGTIDVVSTGAANRAAQREAEAAATESLAAMKEVLEDLRAMVFEFDSDVEPYTAIAWIRLQPER